MGAFISDAGNAWANSPKHTNPAPNEKMNLPTIRPHAESNPVFCKIPWAASPRGMGPARAREGAPASGWISLFPEAVEPGRGVGREADVN